MGGPVDIGILHQGPQHGLHRPGRLFPFQFQRGVFQAGHRVGVGIGGFLRQDIDLQPFICEESEALQCTDINRSDLYRFARPARSASGINESSVRVSRTSKSLFPQGVGQFLGHPQIDGLLFRAMDAERAGVLPTVAGIDHDPADRMRRGFRLSRFLGVRASDHRSRGNLDYGWRGGLRLRCGCFLRKREDRCRGGCVRFCYGPNSIRFRKSPMRGPEAKKLFGTQASRPLFTGGISRAVDWLSTKALSDPTTNWTS